MGAGRYGRVGEALFPRASHRHLWFCEDMRRNTVTLRWSPGSLKCWGVRLLIYLTTRRKKRGRRDAVTSLRDKPKPQARHQHFCDLHCQRRHRRQHQASLFIPGSEHFLPQAPGPRDKQCGITSPDPLYLHTLSPHLPHLINSTHFFFLTILGCRLLWKALRDKRRRQRGCGGEQTHLLNEVSVLCGSNCALLPIYMLEL